MRGRNVILISILALAAFILVACTQATSSAQGPAKNPVDQLKLHLVGVHIMKDEANRQFVAHHYCAQLSSGVIQCAVFDSGSPDAKLMGTEFVVSDEVYNGFSPEEQQNWHPHVYEVDAGLLAAPELPSDQEQTLLQTIRGTHGRTWNVWAVDLSDLPTGQPELAWSITEPGQLRQDIETQLKQEQGR